MKASQLDLFGHEPTDPAPRINPLRITSNADFDRAMLAPRGDGAIEAFERDLAMQEYEQQDPYWYE